MALHHHYKNYLTQYVIIQNSVRIPSPTPNITGTESLDHFSNTANPTVYICHLKNYPMVVKEWIIQIGFFKYPKIY